jgi:hypothetical protein
MNLQPWLKEYHLLYFNATADLQFQKSQEQVILVNSSHELSYASRHQCQLHTMVSLKDKSTQQRLDTASDFPEDGFHYTHILYITPHNLWNSDVKIHDITDSVTAPYPSEKFKIASEAEGQSRADSVPEWIFHNHGFRKMPVLCTGTTTASKKSVDDLIATWKPSRGQYGKNAFIFPPGSAHSGHDIVMEMEKHWKSWDEVFVVESVPYFWRYEGSSRRKFTLWKVVGQIKMVVGRYKGKRRVGKRGGTLLVDADEVDCVVAVMSIMAMLRKVRQRS